MRKYLLVFLTGLMACSHTSRIKSTPAFSNTSQAPIDAPPSASKSTTSTSPPPETVSPELAAARNKVPGVTMAQLQGGEKLYTMDCGRCHELKNPGDFTIHEWEPILTRMYLKARITDTTQQSLIRMYVLANTK